MKKKVIFSETTTGKKPLLKADRIIYIEGGERMKIVSISLVNSLLILLVVLIHKIFFRVLLLGYENLFIYWGSFVLIYFILNLITNKILLPKGK